MALLTESRVWIRYRGKAISGVKYNFKNLSSKFIQLLEPNGTIMHGKGWHSRVVRLYILECRPLAVPSSLLRPITVRMTEDMSSIAESEGILGMRLYCIARSNAAF